LLTTVAGEIAQSACIRHSCHTKAKAAFQFPLPSGTQPREASMYPNS
jgi:hypothetical protein